MAFAVTPYSYQVFAEWDGQSPASRGSSDGEWDLCYLGRGVGHSCA